ncbi:MAG TPA: hypothetical protein VMN36_01895 [Verrucomicrobiales bacterium]|nr:hypothetical protein [Verrucomicrobiales bacterium]
MTKHLTALAFCVLLSALASAAEDTAGHDHDHGHGGGQHHATIVAPGSLHDLWASINAYGRIVAEAAATENFAILHKEQINLETLIAALGPVSQDLEPAKLKRAEGMITNAQRALGLLHEATGSGDAKAARSAATSLSGVLMVLKAQYPKAATAGMAEVKDAIGPHQGMLAEFKAAGGTTAGHLELKLHDDKGDLELWLAHDSAITKPFDLPTDAKVTVSFEGTKVESVPLAIRNSSRNEDEDGNANMRDGGTNYFIFPGDTGADSSWLTGGDFRAKVTISISSSTGSFQTGPFLLIPHAPHEHAPHP